MFESGIKAPWLHSLKRKLVLIITLFLTASIALTMYFISSSLKGSLIEDSINKTEDHSVAIESSMKNLMVARDPGLIQDTLENIGTDSTISKAFVMDPNGRVAFSTARDEIDTVLDALGDESCRACHQNLQDAPPVKTTITSVDGEVVQRSVALIFNEEQCHRCHGSGNSINGKLVIDHSMEPIFALVSSVQFIIFLGGVVCLVFLVPVLWKTVSIGLNRYIGEIERHTSELKMLYMMLDNLSQTIDFRELKHVVVNVMASTLGAEEIYLVMFKEEGDYKVLHWKEGDEKGVRKRIVQGDEMYEVIQKWYRGDIDSEKFCEENKLLCMPISKMKKRIALVIAKRANGGFESIGVGLLRAIGGHIAIAFENARLYHIAITDDLTQLYTQRFFRISIDKEFDNCERYGETMSLLMVDIDDFKKVNDTYGHIVGDSVLKDFAALLRAAVRENDLVFRYGGEEFAVILPSTKESGAQHVAERIRSSIDEAVFEKGALNLHITTSVGGSVCSDKTPTVRDLILNADRALYSAKKAGKNLVVLA